MIKRGRSLLLVTDIQGNLAELMHDRENIYKNLAIMIEGIKTLDIPILWVEQYPKGLGPTVQAVATHLTGLAPLSKTTFSSLKEPAILERFTAFGRDQVLLVGIETHVCIYQTAMDMIARGIEVHVVEDAVSSRSPLNKKIGIEKISRGGGNITSVETALFELLGTAEDESFKKILALVR